MKSKSATSYEKRAENNAPVQLHMTTVFPAPLRMESAHMTKECLVCGKTFTVSHGNQQYCSKECVEIARANTQKKYYQKHKELYKKQRRTSAVHQVRTCDWCGREFVPLSRRHRFCSPECRRASIRGSAPLSEQFYLKTCPVCGKEFNTLDPTDVYCSDVCAHHGILKRLSRGFNALNTRAAETIIRDTDPRCRRKNYTCLECPKKDCVP